MGVEGGMKCVKFLLFFFNFIFWVSNSLLSILMLTIKRQQSGSRSASTIQVQS
ncbi:hypothetical protein FQN60_002282 [Etheostoma spectabile]|uniref:Uncharacterized protein n=1 Tax=Etheostoma spectabile TaxID=54343 RepID=A0A5J5DC41_9PERO|nr:hypothetical protein FQN60_002282 [Etheostoma spectabile]